MLNFWLQKLSFFWLLVFLLGITAAGGALTGFAATPLVAPHDLQLNPEEGTASALELVAFGYHLKDHPNRLCVSCHGREGKKMTLNQLHRRHVDKERLDCQTCHTFTRATAPTPTRRKP